MAKNGVKTCLGSTEEIRKVFERFDKNGDGKISSDELKDVIAALSPLAPPDEATRMMRELDGNGDGFIDLDEFVSHFQISIGRGEKEGGMEDLKDAFDLYDLDRNGLISASELHAVMKRLGEKCSVGDCARMIGQVDTDGDGYVSFEEFKTMMNGKA